MAIDSLVGRTQASDYMGMDTCELLGNKLKNNDSDGDNDKIVTVIIMVAMMMTTIMVP